MPCSFDDIALSPNFAQALQDYATECQLPEMTAIANLDFYKQRIADGLLHPLCIKDGDLLAGFAILIVSEMPHYNNLVLATLESFFVLPEYRCLGVGEWLLREVEAKAKELGASGLFLSAPAGGRLDQYLSKLKRYRETNRVYFSKLSGIEPRAD